MKIFPLDNRYVTAKTTGYITTAAIGLSVISGMSKNKSFRKFHKPFAYLSVLLAATHIGLIEYNHYKWKNSNTRLYR